MVLVAYLEKMMYYLSLERLHFIALTEEMDHIVVLAFEKRSLNTKRLRFKCFQVKFAKFLRTPFL